ncbi:lipopolysaccharide biosynthesis protein [Mesorhizobium cantuariense]|uniref:Lipopolysaccharide biosynthesis protein n=1 Tax=Mesorhizobium cantuariense TaxID=1300275 RepID=A0ABV7MSH7_9HYPH
MKLAFPSHLVRRLVLMIGGEAMQSGFHFALNIMLLHMLSAQGYGLFAIGMVMGGVGLSYIRSLTAVPASIWMSKSTNSAGVDAYDVAFGTAALIVALLMAVGTAVLMHLLGDPSGIAAGCFVGAWSLRSHMRTAFFARRQQVVVSISDGAFTIAGIVLTGLTIWKVQDPLQTVFYALAAANVFGIFALVRLARRTLRISFRMPTRRRYIGLWHQLRWSAFSATTTNIQGQCLALLVAGIAGPAAYAPLAAVLVLFAPLRIISLAFVNMIQPDLARLMRNNETGRVWAQAKIWALVMGLGGLAYGCAIMFVLPMIKSQALQDASVGFIGIFVIANFVPIMLYIMPRIVLEILGDFRIVAFTTLGGAVVGLVLIAILLAIASPPWALVGSAVSEIFVLAASWYFAHHRIWNLEHPDEARDSRLGSWRRAVTFATAKR